MIHWFHNQFLLFIVVVIDLLWDILTSFFLGCLVVAFVTIFIYMVIALRRGCHR